MNLASLLTNDKTRVAHEAHCCDTGAGTVQHAIPTSPSLRSFNQVPLPSISFPMMLPKQLFRVWSGQHHNMHCSISLIRLGSRIWSAMFGISLKNQRAGVAETSKHLNTTRQLFLCLIVPGGVANQQKVLFILH